MPELLEDGELGIDLPVHSTAQMGVAKDKPKHVDADVLYERVRSRFITTTVMVVLMMIGAVFSLAVFLPPF
ncbi:MAG: hypothetical protein AAF125_07155 [Chloroflexota bacterium]